MNKIQVQILWWGFFIALAALLIGGKVLLFPAEKGGSQPVVIVAQDYEASVVALELAAESVKEKSLAKDEAVKNEEALSLKPDEEDNEAKRKQRKDAKETRRKAERDLAAARQTLESLQRRSSVSVAPWLRYVIFGVMALVSTLALWYGIAYQGLLNSLANVSIARGLITFVITIVSIAFGLIVILSAVVLDPPDLEEHFRAGKDVLTIFVGILGTIVGYYFG
ncbi:MAG: hypothetical protein JSS02_32515, partial [Planctomycetes bacterium]|nr:hypothetical protein [Planctomycetota bacterium]